MEISVVHPKINGNLGGAESVSYGILEALNTEHDVKYISVHSESWSKINEYYNYNIPENTEKIQIKTPRSLKILQKSNRLTLAKRSAVNKFFLNKTRTLAKNSDLIVFTSKIWNDNKPLPAPSIQYVHRYTKPIDLSKKPYLYKKLIDSLSHPELYPTDHVLFNSSYTLENNHQTNSKEHIVNPPVDVNFNQKKWSERKNQAIIVGRITKDKKIEEAIKIISKTDLKLVIAGLKQDEKYFRTLKERSGPKVEFKPNLSREELKKEIENSKVGLCCKREEDFGIVVVEYLKAGLLPMVFNNGGPPSIVDKCNFTYQNISEAAEKIEENLENHNQYVQHISERAERYDRKIFSDKIQKIVNSYE